MILGEVLGNIVCVSGIVFANGEGKFECRFRLTGQGSIEPGLAKDSSFSVTSRDVNKRLAVGSKASEIGGQVRLHEGALFLEQRILVDPGVDSPTAQPLAAC